MNKGLELRKFVAPEFIFGADARLLAGRYAKNFGARKVLIVTGPHIMRLGWLDAIIDSLNAENISYEIYSDITPNPRSEQVMRGAHKYEQEGCNAIIAVGGGSPMDCAKGIGIVYSNKKHILEFEGVDQVQIPAPPLICIPTTAGSSADVSQFAIITDEVRKVKIAIVSKTVVPDVALIDPVTTLSMDKYLTVCTGFDVLSHAFEAYVSNASSPITDLHAMEAIRLVNNYLIPVTQNLNNLELRGKLMLASLHAGLAFSNASLGLIHAIAHSLGGFLDLPHGECNALLLEQIVDFNYDITPERYGQIGRIMGIDTSLNKLDMKKAIISRIRDLKISADVNKNLKEVGVKESDINELADKAIRDSCVVTNPRKPTSRDIEEILKNAL